MSNPIGGVPVGVCAIAVFRSRVALAGALVAVVLAGGPRTMPLFASSDAGAADHAAVVVPQPTTPVTAPPGEVGSVAIEATGSSLGDAWQQLIDGFHTAAACAAEPHCR